MRNLFRSTAIVAASAALALFGLVGTANASAVHASKTPAVLSCAGTAQVKPTSITLACADANQLLKSIQWKSWTATSASGTATFSENTCEPSCVAGKFVSYPATVTLSKPVTNKLGLLFSSVAYTYSVTTTATLPLSKL